MTGVADEPRARAASRAVSTAFILMGFAGASWAARIPQIRDELTLNPSGLGLVLLAIALGSIVSLVLAGQIVAHFGSRRTVTAMAALLGVTLGGAAVAFQFGILPLVIALFGYGFANGAWDVAMNVQGAIVERRLGRAIMPRFHAGYSVGTVAGALAGAAAVALHVSVTTHLLVARHPSYRTTRVARHPSYRTTRVARHPSYRSIPRTPRARRAGYAGPSPPGGNHAPC